MQKIDRSKENVENFSHNYMNLGLSDTLDPQKQSYFNDWFICDLVWASLLEMSGIDQQDFRG